MTDVANLDIKVDATSVDGAKKSLDGFNAAGRETSATAKQVMSATAQMAEQIRQVEQAYRSEYQAAKQSATATNEQAKASQAAATATGQLNQAVRMSASEYRAMTAATKAQTEATMSATAAHQSIVNAIRSGAPVSAQAIRDAGGLANAMKIMEKAHLDAGKGIGGVEKAAGAAGKAVGGLHIQTSTFVRELLVLGREAGRGDFTRMAGSATILAQAMGLLELAITPIGLGIIAVGAAIGATIGIVAAGQKEFFGLQNSLTVTGNYAGLTADSFDDMAKKIATSQDVGIRSVKASMAELVGSGKFTADTIQLMVSNAEYFSKMTGQKAEDVVKDYETMKGGVVKFAVKHEEVYHDLTLAQIDYIDQLEKAGKHHEAELKLMDDIASKIKDRVVPQFGWLQQTLHWVAVEASGMWDKILGIGRPKTIDEQIGALKSKLATMDDGDAANMRAHPNNYKGSLAGGLFGGKSLLDKIDDTKLQLSSLEATKAMQERQAQAQAKTAQEEDDKIRKKYDNQGFHANRKAPVDQVKEKLEALTAEAAGNRLVADSYDMSTAAGFKAEAMKKAMGDAAKANGKASQFEAAELEVAVTKSLADGSKTLLQMQQKTSTLDMVNAKMADGTISQQEANEAVKDELAIRALQAAADNATGADKQKLLALITTTRDAQTDANRAAREGQMINATNSARDSNADMEVQLKLINATNRERAEALAIMQAKRDLEKMGVHDFTDPKATAYIGEKVKGAKLGQDLSDGLGDTIKQQQFYLTLVDEMASRTSSAAADMGSAFGGLGEAIGNLTTVFTDHYAAVQDMQLDYDQRVKDANGNEEKISAIERARLDASRQQNIKYYGDVLGAAADMFDKKSAGYKVLHAAEQAYRAFEFASSIASIAVKAAEAAGKIPLNSAITASNVAAGASSIFAVLGPFGFPIVAAMVAVMAGLGFSGGGGGGVVVSAKERQDQQGTGSVFGDTKAKSESISKSIELSTKNSNQMLEYTSDMASSLHRIENALASTTNAVIRALGAGGSLDTSGLGLGTTVQGPGTLQKILNPLSALLPGLFGKKTTTSLTDVGLDFGSQSLSSIMSGGINGNTYTDLASETKKKFLGITYSDKTSTSTVTGQIDSELKNSVTTLVGSLRTGILSAATVLGVDGAEQLLATFQVNIGKISFKDMTGDEIQKALEAVFSKVGDDMATTVLPAVNKFQKAGEGAMETLVRLARDYQVVDVSLRAIGKTFGAVGVASIEARERLVGLFDSLDDFVSASGYFQEHFLSDAEKLAPIQSAVATEMDRLGVGAVHTKDGFKQLVLGLDLTTVGGQDMYAALMKVAPAFDTVASAATAALQKGVDDANDILSTANKTVEDDKNNLISAYQNESKAMQEVITSTQKMIDGLKAYQKELDYGASAGLSPQDQYSAQSNLFNSTASAAAGGDQQAITDLPTVADAFLQASRGYNASSQPYFDDLKKVKEAVAKALNVAQKQLDGAKAQQQALDDMVNSFATANGLLLSVSNGVVTVNNSVLSVVSAMGSLSSSLAAAAVAQQGVTDAVNAQTKAIQDAATTQAQAIQDALNRANNTPTTVTNTDTGTGTTTAPPTYGSVADSIVANRPDVVAAANNLLATADRNSPWFAQHGLDNGVAGFADWWYANRPADDTWTAPGFATGGDFMVGGSGGTDSKKVNFRATPGEMVSIRTPGTAGKGDEETKELLRDIRSLLDGGNQQRGQAAQEQVKKLGEVVNKLDASKRAARSNA